MAVPGLWSPLFPPFREDDQWGWSGSMPGLLPRVVGGGGRPPGFLAQKPLLCWRSLRREDGSRVIHMGLGGVGGSGRSRTRWVWKNQPKVWDPLGSHCSSGRSSQSKGRLWWVISMEAIPKCLWRVWSGEVAPHYTLSWGVASPTDRRSTRGWRKHLQVLRAHLRASKLSVNLTFKMLKITFVSVLFKLSP